MKNKYICLEGISGSGKTYLFNQLREKHKNNHDYIFLGEVFDEEHSGLDELIFSTLYHTEDRFFDMGIPLTETTLLLAKKMYQHESILRKSIKNKKYVIQDRGIDTVAIYQAILILRKHKLGMSPMELVEHIHNFIDKYFIIPDTTILLYGDINNATKRAETRDNLPYTASEKELLESAERLYLDYANKHLERFVMINISDKTCDQILSIIEQALYVPE